MSAPMTNGANNEVLCVSRRPRSHTEVDGAALRPALKFSGDQPQRAVNSRSKHLSLDVVKNLRVCG